MQLCVWALGNFQSVSMAALGLRPGLFVPQSDPSTC